MSSDKYNVTVLQTDLYKPDGLMIACSFAGVYRLFIRHVQFNNQSRKRNRYNLPTNQINQDQ